MAQRRPELQVPDLTRPAGADIDRHGEVRCVTCGTRVSVMDADVVGLGYRCARCSAVATPDDDEVASLPVHERLQIRRMPQRSSFVIVGALFFAIAALMWIMNWDVEWHSARRGFHDLFLIVVVIAIGSFGLAAAPRGR